MNRFYGIICGVIAMFILFYAFRAEAYLEEPGLAEVLSKELQVYAVFKGMTLDYQLKKDEELEVVSEGDFNNVDLVLKASKEIIRTPDKATGTHTLKRRLDVQAQNGQRYCLKEGTVFNYTLPPIKSGYTVTIPPKTRIYKKIETNPPRYALADDLTVQITPPDNLRVTLTVAAQSVVARIPGTAGTSATLEFEPKRAPAGEYITLTLQQSQFAFEKAQFYVLLRQGENGALCNTSLIASNEVEPVEVQRGKAKLRARIPEINKNGDVRAEPVDLIVVARRPDGEPIDAVAHGFLVSSRQVAILCWIFAFVLPWLIAGIVTGRKKPGQPSRFNPIWFVSGKHGSASLSLAQILLWTIIVFSASFYVLVVSGKLLDLTPDVLTLLGIAGGASVIAKIAASAKDGKGRDIAALPTKDPKCLDLFQTEGRPDLYKFQMALFTVLAALFVVGKIYRTLVFPELPAGLLTLIGISNGVYLGAKATSKTVFEKIAEKYNELQKAEEDLKEYRQKSDEAVTLEEEVKKELAEATKAKDATAINEAKDRLKAAEKGKAEAEKAKVEAENKVKTLQKEFKKLE